MSEIQPTSRASSDSQSAPDVHAAVEIAVRLGVLFLMVAWCLVIVAPFVGIVAWALIIAIAADHPYLRLRALLGGRRELAATILVIVALAGLLVPAVMLSETMVDSAQRFASSLTAGSLSIPAPPESVRSWPLVGGRVHDFWLLASQNLAAALAPLGPQLKAVSAWLLSAAGSAGVAVLQLAGSLVLAGFLMARNEGRQVAIDRFASRLAGDRGPEFANLARATIQSVVQGILGVAIIQALLAGLGFIVADVPGAGLWALLVLVAAVVQLPVALVMVPPVLLVFSAASLPVAVTFAIWCSAVGLLDNFLKPILFGRGVQLPTVVIFLGAIGGMLAMGIIGLFLGAVILALGYKLFVAWMGETESPDATVPASGPSGTG